jgi:hypothetical protein
MIQGDILAACARITLLGVPSSVTCNESHHGYDDHRSRVYSMTKAQAASQKALFGHDIKRRTSRLKSLLTHIHRESYQIHLERWRMSCSMPHCQFCPLA